MPSYQEENKDELEELRLDTVQAYHNRDNEGMSNFKCAKNAYRKACRRAKGGSWKNFVGETPGVKEMSTLQKIAEGKQLLKLNPSIKRITRQLFRVRKPRNIL